MAEWHCRTCNRLHRTEDVCGQRMEIERLRGCNGSLLTTQQLLRKQAAEAEAEIERLQGGLAKLTTIIDSQAEEIERLNEACRIFLRYGLPPHDVSGSAEWERARTLASGGEGTE